MAARSKYFCQIQACNVMLVIVGLTASSIAASQFWNISVKAKNLRIDLRLLNWIYVLAGLAGLYTLARNHGIVVSKTLHCVSIVVAICSAAFYCDTLFRIVRLRERSSPQNEIQDQEFSENYAIRLVICSLMISLPIIAFLASLIAVILLDRFIVITQPTWPQYSRGQNKRHRTNHLGLTASASAKLLMALCALALTVFLKYENQLTSTRNLFMLTDLDHIAILLAIISAVVDLHSVVINRQPATNYKIAIGLDVIAAVWCLKSLDIEMYPNYYVNIQNWRKLQPVTQNETLTLSDTMDRNYLIIVIKSILVALFALLFGLNLLSAVQASKCIQYEYCGEGSMIKKSVTLQCRCLGLLHLMWGMLLMVLVVIGFVKMSWNANYVGADLLWLAILLFATGILCITYSDSQLSMNFVLGFICFACALEKMCSSINLTYLSASYVSSHGSNDAFLGRLILHCIQFAILFLETITGLFSVIIYGSMLRQRYCHALKHSACIYMVLLLGNMFYGIVLVGCHVIFTLGYKHFTEFVVEIPFFYMGNGLLVFGISILQGLSLCYPALLLPVTTLNVIAASLALFLISYMISNTYFLAAQLFIVEEIYWVVVEVALILTASAALACIICTFCSTFAVISLLYAMNRKPRSHASTAMLCEENNYGTLQTLVTPQLQTPPVRHMEEQSIYWSTDENPYYYQASKRYYDQPYNIDSGFYGYALVSPQMFNSSYTVMGANSNVGAGSERYSRNINSSAAQTRIGHIFS